MTAQLKSITVVILLIGTLFISQSVEADPITFTEDQILSMTRQYMINNLNIQHEEHFIQDEYLIIVYSMNHIEKVNDTYVLQRGTYYTNMPLAIIDYCRSMYSNAVCRNQLLTNTNEIQGVYPIYYQVKMFALNEIGLVEQYQYNIQLSRTTLGEDLMEGGIGSPDIE